MAFLFAEPISLPSSAQENCHYTQSANTSVMQFLPGNAKDENDRTAYICIYFFYNDFQLAWTPEIKDKLVVYKVITFYDSRFTGRADHKLAMPNTE